MTKQPITGAKFIGYDLRNDNYKEGQHGICMGYGIGETVRDYAIKNKLIAGALSTIQATNDAAIRRVVDTAEKYDMVAAIDKYQFNVVSIASLDNYSAGEYEADVAYSKDAQKNDTTSMIWHSQGGYGGFRRIVDNPSMLDGIDSIVVVASGPGNMAAAPIVAAAKVPVWFIVTEGDNTTKNPDLWIWNVNMHKAILKAGGISYLTLLGSENNFANNHAILGLVLTRWGTEGVNPLVGEKGYKAMEMIPTMNVYEWMMSNKKGQPVVAPDGVFKAAAKAYQPVIVDGPVVGGPVVEPPPPVIPPIETKPKVTMIYPDRIQVSMTAKNGPILANLKWSDGSDVVQVVKDEVNTYIDLVNDPKGVRGSIAHKSGTKQTLKTVK